MILNQVDVLNEPLQRGMYVYIYLICCVYVHLHMWDVYGVFVFGCGMCTCVCTWCVYGEAYSHGSSLLQVVLACGTISHVGSLLK